MSYQNSRAISGIVDRPIETCPECGESEQIRAYKYTDDDGFWSQCIPCRDSDIEFDGWFLEPETKSGVRVAIYKAHPSPLGYDFMQKVLELRDKWVSSC